jgi:hypothetical protein
MMDNHPVPTILNVNMGTAKYAKSFSFIKHFVLFELCVCARSFAVSANHLNKKQLKHPLL